MKGVYPQTDLDTLGKEVSGLGGVFGGNEGGSDLVNNVGSGVGVLAEKAKDSEHGQSAVLDFLDLLLVEFFGSVVQVEWVDARARSLSQLKVTGQSVGALLLDQRDTSKFDQGKDQDQLGDGLTGYVLEFLNGVLVGVSIDTGPVVTGEGSEKRGPDETENGQLSDASVGDLGLAQPLNIGHAISGRGLGVEERRHRGGGESDGVETDITGKGSVKSGGAPVLGERKSSRGTVEWNSVQGSAGNRLLGGGEGGRRSDQGCGDNELHGCMYII